eukprot:gene32773-43807_t
MIFPAADLELNAIPEVQREFVGSLTATTFYKLIRNYYIVSSHQSQPNLYLPSPITVNDSSFMGCEMWISEYIR